MRIILTFENTHQLLAAEKALKTAVDRNFQCRPTPTPQGLSASICGMSLEVMQILQKDEIVKFLDSQKMSPQGVHEV